MIFTARQLEEMHRSNGHVTLPQRARLTPLAQDWIKHKNIQVTYADNETINAHSTPAGGNALEGSTSAISAAKLLWWCDGPCGPAKAAIMTQSRKSAIADLGIAHDRKQLVPAIR